MNPALAEVLDEMPDDGTFESWQDWWENLTDDMRAGLKSVASDLPLLGPMEGPQRQAFVSKAHDTGYGGGAGGGKTGLIAILVLLAHHRSVIFRYDAKQLRAFVEEVKAFSGQKSGLNWQQGVMYFADVEGHMMEWGGLGAPGAQMAWRGRAHDFLAIDEATEVARHKIFFLTTWLRTTREDQRTRMLLTFNPPGADAEDVIDTGESGMWLVDHYAPWVNDRHPNPAYPGEIRYFLTNEVGESQEVATDEPVVMTLRDRTFVQKPQKRTFIPALVEDNKYLMGTDYIQNLLRLGEPDRSRMLLGMFRVDVADHPRQVIPTKWVDDAMTRWSPEGRRTPMLSVGVDVSRGGRDETVLARRHGLWWDKLLCVPGHQTTDGGAVMTLIAQNMSPSAEVCIDAQTVSASPVDMLQQTNIKTHLLYGAGTVKSLPRINARFEFYNLRTWLYWWLRTLLDPEKGLNVALPPDNKLRYQLIEPRYDWRIGGKILMEPKSQIKERLRMSPDRADAVVYSAYNIIYEPEVEQLVKRSNVNFGKLYPERGGYRGATWMAR